MIASLFCGGSIDAASIKAKPVRTIEMSSLDGSKTLFNARDFFTNKKKILHELREYAHNESSSAVQIQQYRLNSFEVDVEEAFTMINKDIESLVLTQHQIYDLICQLRYDKRFLKAPSNLFLFKDPQGCLNIFSVAYCTESMRLTCEIICLDGQSMSANPSLVGNIFVPRQP